MSEIQLTPFVNFHGRAREALAFYHTVLGGTVELTTIDAQGGSKPAGPADRITRGRLEADGAVLVASDGHPDYPPAVGNNMAITIRGTGRGRLATIFHALAEGGRVQMPMNRQPGGTETGWLVDKFGVTWEARVEGA